MAVGGNLLPLGVQGQVTGDGLGEVKLLAALGRGEPAAEAVAGASGCLRGGNGLAILCVDGLVNSGSAVVQDQGDGVGDRGLLRHLGAEAVQDGGNLSAGGQPLGGQLVVHAVHQTCAHGPLHGRDGVVADRQSIGIAQNVGVLAHRDIIAHEGGIAVEDGGQLFPGDEIVGAKGGGIVAGDHAIGSGPGHGLCVVLAVVHVQESAGTCGGLTGQPVEDGDDHAAGGVSAGVEGGVRGAVHEALVLDILDFGVEPVIGSYVRKGLAGGGQGAGGHHGKQHGQGQSHRKQFLFHGVSFRFLQCFSFYLRVDQVVPDYSAASGATQ